MLGKFKYKYTLKPFKTWGCVDFDIHCIEIMSISNNNCQ